MKSKEIKKFKEFLRNEGCAAQFYNNVRLYFDPKVGPTNVEKYLKVTPAKFIFVTAFDWIRMKEGPDYWIDVATKWRYIID